MKKQKECGVDMNCINIKRYKRNQLAKIILVSLFSTGLVSAEEAIWETSVNNTVLNQKSDIEPMHERKPRKRPKLRGTGMDDEESLLMKDTARSLRGNKLTQQKAHINSEDENVNYIDIKNQGDYNDYIAEYGELGTEIRNQSNKEVINVVNIKNAKVDEGLFGVRVTGSTNVNIINSVTTKNVETIDDMEPEIQRDCLNETTLSKNRNLTVDNTVQHDDSDVANSVFGVTSYEENCQ